jgi:hypothetical protein
MLHDDIQARLRPRQPPPVEYQSPQLIVDAIGRHEGGHVCIGVALGQRIEYVKLSRNANGSTNGSTCHTDGLDVIASMIALAAGPAAQRRYGAVDRFYDDWARDDERQMIGLALDLVETQPRRDRKANALKLIAGAEAVAARMVDSMWDDIERVARELVRFEHLDADDVAALTKDVPRINFREASAGEGMMDGVPFRRRDDGYLKPIGGGGH